MTNEHPKVAEELARIARDFREVLSSLPPHEAAVLLEACNAVLGPDWIRRKFLGGVRS